MQALLRCSFVASLPRTRVWEFAKMAGIWAYAHTIRELGSAAVAFTGYGEASHKGVKPCINQTNRHHGSFLGQVRMQSCWQEMRIPLGSVGILLMHVRCRGRGCCPSFFPTPWLHQRVPPRD